MSFPWFRMYCEFATDPDIQSLAFEDQRHYVVLLCLKCNGTLDKDYPTSQRRYTVIRRTLGLDSVAIDEAKNRLMEAGLIDQFWQPLTWDKRQYVSDSSTERVRRWREKRLRNVSVTPPDTDTDPDTDNPPTSLRSVVPPPKKRPSKRCPQEFQVTEDLMAWAAEKYPDVDVDEQTEAFRDHEFATAKRDWPAAWRSWIRKAAKFSGGSKGAAETQRKTRYEQFFGDSDG